MKNNTEIMNAFLTLASQLSQENLTCDGELSKRQVQIKLRQLRTEWKRLENQIGRTMTEDEVWQWYLNNKDNPSFQK